MDWGPWNPTHTALVIFGILAFAGQVAVYFYRTRQNDKKLEKQGEKIEQLGEKLERQGEELRLALKAQGDELTLALNKQGETFFHALERLEARMDGRFSDLQGEIRDVRIELSKLNQNHIDHLTHHN